VRKRCGKEVRERGVGKRCGREAWMGGGGGVTFLIWSTCHIICTEPFHELTDSMYVFGTGMTHCCSDHVRPWSSEYFHTNSPYRCWVLGWVRWSGVVFLLVGGCCVESEVREDE
jgi:hypothetical protein